MTLKFKLSAYLLIASIFGQVSGMSVIKNYIHLCHSKAIGFKEISEKHYPKTVAYFEKLRLKYPQALKDVQIVIAPVAGPISSSYVIMFPLAWIEELECEMVKAQNIVEWVILHEAGHVYHSHLAKLLLAQWATLGVSIGSIATYYSYSDKQWGFKEFAYAGLAIYAVMITEVLAYSRYMMEPQADDFANELCDNPQAFIDAAWWLERVAFDGMTHPTSASRIEKIEQALQKRFGISLPK